MDRASIERLARFFGRERLGHLYLKAWRFLVDGMGRRLALPDYVGERILDYALMEFDTQLEDFRRAVDARPSIFLFSLGWIQTHEILKPRAGDSIKIDNDTDFWEPILGELTGPSPKGAGLAVAAALDAVPLARHRILLRLDAVARGPANRQVVSEAIGVGQLKVDDIREDARAEFRRRVEEMLADPSQLRSAPRPNQDADNGDPMCDAICHALTIAGQFPPIDDLEALYIWLQQNFDRSPAEVALASLWKRLPPPETIEREKPKAESLVALTQSLYERFEKLERIFSARLDRIDRKVGLEPAMPENVEDSALPSGDSARDSARDSGRDSARDSARDSGRETAPDDEAARGSHSSAERDAEDDLPVRGSSSAHGSSSGSLFGGGSAAAHEQADVEPAVGTRPRRPIFKIERQAAGHSMQHDTGDHHDDSMPHDASSLAYRDGERNRDADHDRDRDGRYPENQSPGSPDRGPLHRDPLQRDPQRRDDREPGNTTESASAPELPEAEAGTDARRSPLTSLFRAMRPGGGERTHQEVVERLEKYLPTIRRARVDAEGAENHDSEHDLLDEDDSNGGA